MDERAREADRWARVLWDFHRLGLECPTMADLLLVTGSHDLRVADRGAELAKSCQFKVIVVSGGAGKITADSFHAPEAILFRDRMVELGVPDRKIRVEPLASNSGENIVKTRELLDREQVQVGTGVLVTKPYMERRLLATAQKQWPEANWTVTSPLLEYDTYPSDEVPWVRMVELMVGDLQRLEIYAVKGFQTPQWIPDPVWDAYHELIALGFDAQVIKE